MDKDEILQEATDARIDSFIRGTMTAEEEAAFKQEIKADPDLRNQVLATVSLIKGIREQDAAQKKEIIQSNTKHKARTIMLWACSIAAVFVVFFGYQKYKRFNELSALVSPYYMEYSMSDASRGDVDSVTVVHLYTLFNNIKDQNDVSNIIEELEPIYTTIDTDFTYNTYANDIVWNLALAYIKDDQIGKAISVLEKLIKDNPDTLIAIKAKELIEKLQKK